MRYPLVQMLVSVIMLRSFAWVLLILPVLAAVAFVFQEPMFAFLNLEGSLDLPLTPELLILLGLGGVLAWALLSGFALIIESSVATAWRSKAALELLAQVRDALEVAGPLAEEAPEELEEPIEPEKPKAPLTFDNWY